MSRRVPAESPVNQRSEPAQLRAGRERAKIRRRQQAVKRVATWRRWNQSGGRLRDIPPIPSSADFRIAQEERR